MEEYCGKAIEVTNYLSFLLENSKQFFFTSKMYSCGSGCC